MVAKDYRPARGRFVAGNAVVGTIEISRTTFSADGGEANLIAAVESPLKLDLRSSWRSEE
jgi:hypothetical protein